MTRNHYSNVLRTMRLHYAETSVAHDTYSKAIQKVDELLRSDEITRTVYDREVASAQVEFNFTIEGLISKAKSQLVPEFEAMRLIAHQQAVKSPTPEIVSTLQILGMLDNLTPTQLSLYIESLSECPLAMQMLSQMAMKHNLRLIVEEQEHRLRLLDVFEDHVANFLTNYKGTEGNLSVSVRKMLPYLQTEDTLMKHGGTRRVDLAFWREFVGEGSPDCYDEDSSSTEKPRVQYFFKDTDGLLAFISKASEGMSDSIIEEIVNTILANCPESYGSAYRNFLACGDRITFTE